MPNHNRRSFLTASVAAGLASVKPGTGVAASGKLSVGVMGCGRGIAVATEFAKRSDCVVSYVCDVDQSKLGGAAAAMESITGDIPKRVTDVRLVLEDPEVDILIVATPEHWHALGTVWACQAGKHVYVEKPMAHNIHEGRKMVEVARKYNRVVQVGIQTRSEPYAQKAVEYIQSGKLGKVHQVRVVHMDRSPWIESARLDDVKVDPVPEGLDYDMWCGPAPMVPYSANKWSRRLKWDFSGGQLWDDGVHQLDAARWLIGRRYPKSVHNAGGVYNLKDGRDCQDTLLVTWEFDDDLLLTFQGSHLTPYIKKNSREMMFYRSAPKELLDDPTRFPDWLFNGTRVEVYGTDGLMIFGRLGGGWQVWGPDGGIVAEEQGNGHELEKHVDNFITCIRNGGQPTGDVEEGHLSDVLYHLANISYRVGGRQLIYDGKAESFPNDPDANKLLGRSYRKPWVMPDKV